MKSDVETQIKLPTTELPVAKGVAPEASPAAKPAPAVESAPTISPVQSKSQTNLPTVPPAQRFDVNGDPYADLDFGDVDVASGDASKSAAPTGERKAGPDDTWGSLEAVPAPAPLFRTGAQDTQQPFVPEPATPSVAASAAPAATPAPPATPAALDAIPAPKVGGGGWGNLDAIPTPKSGGASAWGDLDAIPAPNGGGSETAEPRRGGLTGLMAGKARASSTSKPFSKSRQAIAPEAPAASATVAEPISDADAQSKLNAALAKKTVDETADYIFATPGLDPRMAGRVSAWIQEIEEKDRYVGGHARQVAEISVAIAKEANLSQEECDKVRLAGLLHDVGKRACPPEVLRKRDEDLTDPELIVMMKHPIDGAELLESFPDLKPIAEIVRSHHEEFDGNGYPQGLKGNEIPVAARIVALANIYHGMVGEKTYGPGMPAQKAQEELVKCAGKQFDPMFVQCLIQAAMAKRMPSLS
jgi:putative nucleotidyltransferase with HDIG domain